MNIHVHQGEMRPKEQSGFGNFQMSFPLFFPPLLLGPCHKGRAGGCCTQLGSLSALKHAVLGLYLLVFLILVGIFILAGKSILCHPGL